MKLNELMEIVHGAYPDEITRLCWDAQKNQTRTDQGDTLAAFIVQEIADTYDGLADTGKQLNEALDAMQWATTELGAVIAALEKRRHAYAQTGR